MCDELSFVLDRPSIRLVKGVERKTDPDDPSVKEERRTDLF